ncbi:uncharacterized protein LOC128218418 [Mya arenaria]|uniref:uncharacterized protein LOC128218418 n=1 Tax=Mya arenaria TaxID=6604 RepID=UPI0022E3B430|nr:uncharacterized protein LOC128218418 [Mya arenaria]
MSAYLLQKCIETIIKKICFGNHGIDNFKCPVCRRQCKTWKGGKDMGVIMKAFPENRLMNDLLEGRENESKHVHHAVFIEQENKDNIKLPKKVLKSLWTYVCILNIFKTFSVKLDLLSFRIGKKQALLNGHINRKFVAKFSTILLNNIEVNDDESHGIPNTTVPLVQQIETIESNIKCLCGDAINRTFLKDLVESDWIDPNDPKYKYSQTFPNRISLMLGFSNLSSLSYIGWEIVSKNSYFPMFVYFTGSSKLFPICIGTLKLLGSLCLTYMYGILTWWSVLAFVLFIFTVYLRLWTTFLNRKRWVYAPLFNRTMTNLCLHHIAVDDFSPVGKITHAIQYVENVCRFVFLGYALYEYVFSFVKMPMLFYLVYDIVIEIVCIVVLRPVADMSTCRYLRQRK